MRLLDKVLLHFGVTHEQFFHFAQVLGDFHDFAASVLLVDTPQVLIVDGLQRYGLLIFIRILAKQELWLWLLAMLAESRYAII